MNVKLNIQKVYCLLDKRFSIEQIAAQVGELANRSALLLPPPQPGAGYWQWTLPGEGWQPLSKAEESVRSAIAAEHKRRCETLRASLSGSPIQELVAQVPSEDYIYYRQQDGECKIALVAWGFCFPDTPPCKELEAWIVKNPVQRVRIGFSWTETLLPGCRFRLNGLERCTQADGWFDVDAPVPVGKSYPVETMAGERFTLLVEAGKADYVYDLTRYFTVCARVLLDDNPVSEQTLSLSFGTVAMTLTTDSAGQAEYRLPLVSGPDGAVLVPQPPCHVSCKEQSLDRIPEKEDEVLVFDFSFRTPPPEQPEEQPPIPVQEPPKVEEPASGDAPSEGPGSFTIRLFDYGGKPLPDMPFTLVTRNHGEQELVTDAKGCCKVSRSAFSPGEKLRVRFTVTKAYQKTHDIFSKPSKDL